MRAALLIVAVMWGPPVLAQNSAAPVRPSFEVEPELRFSPGKFALPTVEYRAPDGTWKRSSGIIVGHDISPNAAVGIGFFRMKPKYQDSTVLTPSGGKSKKVSLGLSLRF